MNGSIRIVGAIVTGSVLVTAAFFARTDDAPTAPSVSAVAGSDGAPARTFIKTEDSDGDGRKDWQQSLEEARLAELSAFDVGTTSYERSDTLTDQFAEAFFERVVRSSAGAELTEADQSSLVSSSVRTLETQARDELITYADITVAESDELPAKRAYGNAISQIMIEHWVEIEDPLVLAQEVLSENSTNVPEDLATWVEMYDTVLAETMATPVPPSLRREHLQLLNAYQAVRNDIDAIGSFNDDPMYTLVRIKRYQDDLDGIAASYRQLVERFELDGIRYTDGEPGSLLYYFEI